MHDEDSAIGLDVTDPSGTLKWTMYGDKRLSDTDNQFNKSQALMAVQTSADEIFTAWSTGTVPVAGSYQAWKYAPTLASTRSDN